MKAIYAPISPGELIDKLTILQLKSERIANPQRLANVQTERELLLAVAQEALPERETMTALWNDLYEINADLWSIEDDLRAFEERADFGAGFVALARSVYIANDKRAAIKRQINLLLESPLVEEKSYRHDQK